MLLCGEDVFLARRLFQRRFRQLVYPISLHGLDSIRADNVSEAESYFKRVL